jgi:PleD family two-component response regulator
MGSVREVEDWTNLSDRADAQLYEAKKTRREFVIRS